MDTPSIPIRKKKRYIPMIFAAGGWNANVLYVWATKKTVTVAGKKPVVTIV